MKTYYVTRRSDGMSIYIDAENELSAIANAHNRFYHTACKSDDIRIYDTHFECMREAYNKPFYIGQYINAKTCSRCCRSVEGICVCIN